MPTALTIPNKKGKVKNSNPLPVQVVEGDDIWDLVQKGSLSAGIVCVVDNSGDIVGFATEATLAEINAKVSTEAKQDDTIENQTDGSQKTQIVDSSENVISSQNNRLDVNSNNGNLEIPRGRLSGMTSVNKFGRAIDGVQQTLTDIWDRANATPTQQIWIAPTQARIHTILSTSDEDSDTGGTVAQGDGARTIRVFGLTAWNTAEVSEDIVMDGTATGGNAYTTVNSYVIIHRMRVLTKGNNAGGPNVGVITATAVTDGTVTAQINVAEGQTQMAIYGIPSTQTAYMTCYYGSIHDAGVGVAAYRADMLLKVNPEPDAELINFLIKNTNGLQSTGTGYARHCFEPYFKIPGPAIIKIQMIGTADDGDASAGFDLILVDN